jgi:hypothetical protein
VGTRSLIVEPGGIGSTRSWGTWQRRAPEHNDRVPDLAYFTPYRATDPARARGCLTCTHFLGRFYAEHLLCERDGGRYVVGVAAQGCAFWQREAGADDS